MTIMMVLMLVPIIAVCGVAIDRFRIITAKSTLQEASDMAAMAAAQAWRKNPNKTDAQLKIIAQKAFNLEPGISQFASTPEFNFIRTDGQFSVNTATTISKGLSSIVGFNDFRFQTKSIANVESPKLLEIAMVLDNTYSMSGTKLDSLKVAAQSVVDTLITPDSGNDVKIGIVPFSKYVNIGLGNRNKSWLDIADDYSETTYQCWDEYPDYTESNCRDENNTCYNDGVPYSCVERVCDIDWGDPVEVCGNDTVDYIWEGCVGSRDAPKDQQDDSYNLHPILGWFTSSCNSPITALTSNKTTLSNAIDVMFASEDTYIPAGLAWGWRVLSSQAPYSEGQSTAYMASHGGSKVLILMTDGANTRSPSYPAHSGYDETLANNLTKSLCDNIKTDEIHIYTIAFQVTDADTLSMLKDCASDSGSYFDPDNIDTLQENFQTIANRYVPIWFSK
ncbi:MAG: hypothetical protein ACWA5L_04340 [bacterium]